MDQLVAYSSDSDNSSNSDTNQQEGQDTKSEEVKIDSSLQQKSFDDICLPGTQHEAEQEESTQVDFFGFTNIETKDFEQMTFPNSDTTDDHKFHNVHGVSVEVPVSEFWEDFTEAEIPKEDSENDRLAESHKRKFESVIKPDDCKKVQVLDSASVQRREVRGNAKICFKHYSNNAPSSYHKNHDKPDFTKATPLESNLAIKVYTVHPKISPHLGGHHSNHCACKESNHWAAHSAVVNKISWCSAPSFSHLILSASMDNTVRVWNAWGQQTLCLRTLTTHTKGVRDAQWNGDGRRILSCSYDRTASVTDVETGQSQVQFEHSSYVSAGKFHPVMPHLVATGTTGCVQVWDIRKPEVPIRIMTHKEELGQVQDLMFSHDGQELFSCGDVVARESADRSIVAWDFRTGVILSNQIYQERYTVTRLCLHPSQPQFLAQTQAGYVAVFSLQQPYKMNKNKRFEGHKSAGYNIGMSISQDGSLVYSGSADSKLHCYNFYNCKRIRTINSRGILLDIAAHPVLSSVVAGATWDGDIVIFQ